MFKILETKYKILLAIVVLLIVIPLFMWLVSIVHDGVIHFFGGKTKDDIISEQKVAINKLTDVKVNNEKTITVIKKKNEIDVKHISDVNSKINKVSDKTDKIKKQVNSDLDKYIQDAALLLKDKSLLEIDTNKSTVTQVTEIRKQHIKKTIIVKKKVVKKYIVDKKKYEVEGYKNITLIWDTYNYVKDVK